MLAKMKGAAKTVVASNNVVSATREPRKTLSVRKKKKEEILEKGLRRNPFILACANGRLDIVKSELLADEQYPVNEKFGEIQGDLPLHYAAYYGHKDIAEALANNPCDVFACNNYHENALHSACEAGHVEMVDFLTTWVREKPLRTYEERKKWRKYYEKREENKKHQLDAGIAEVDVVESDEEVEPEWTEENADEAEERLINQESNHRATPIMRAAKKGHYDVINLLCQQGADNTIVNSYGDSALT